jgi:hypothetical protein
MVTKVINQVKKEYRFVDLLKPESHVVCAILLAIIPKLSHLMEVILLNWDQGKNKPISGTNQPHHNGQLAATSGDGGLTLAKSLKHALGNDAVIFNITPVSAGKKLAASQLWGKIKNFSSNISQYIIDETSLFGEGVNNQKLKLLHVALQKWRNEEVISTSWEDPSYLSAVTEIGNEGKFNYVVFGHTHLPKNIKIRCNEREITYLNTGTWADTMQIPSEVFDNNAIENGALQKFVSNLKANQLDSYVKRQLSYVVIQFSGNKVTNAQLSEFSGTGTIFQ